ncbi:T9SS type A sorting domain-containing protein [Hymenobacter elongatus]|nr:T9SS type A sorting domain-containing protein [Hymenobacter elongatus]
MSLGTLHAQSISEMPVRQPFELPQALRLEKSGLTAATAQRNSNSTGRKPGKATTYGWNFAANQWQTTASVEAYTYDSQGRLAQIVERDSATQRLTERISWTYNAAGLQTSDLQEKWDGTVWQNQSRSQDTYNSFGSLTEHLEQSWVNGAWQNLFRFTLDYDARHHIVASTNAAWRNNAWVITYGTRATVTYNAAGAVLEETQDYLDPTSGLYSPGPRRRYAYPSPTALEYSERIDQQWRPASNTYENQQRIANIGRDAQGRETSSESEYWINGAWVLSSRFTTAYQANGSTQGLYEQRQNNAWVGLGRYTHSFDEHGNELGNVSEIFANNAWSVQEAYRYILRYNAAQDLVARIRQNYDTTAKSYYSSLKHIYSGFQSITLGVNPAAALAAQTQLYPNPTEGAATLVLSGLSNQAIPAEIVNSLGQVVQRLTLQPHQGHMELDLSSQPAGMYIVHLQTAAGLVVKKVVRK